MKKRGIQMHTKEETNVHVGVQVYTHALRADLKEWPKWKAGWNRICWRRQYGANGCTGEKNLFPEVLCQWSTSRMQSWGDTMFKWSGSEELGSVFLSLQGCKLPEWNLKIMQWEKNWVFIKHSLQSDKFFDSWGKRIVNYISTTKI